MSVAQKRKPRWPKALAMVLLVALIALSLGGAFAERTDQRTARPGQTFTTGPFELRFDHVKVDPTGWDPSTAQVVITGDARLLGDETAKIDNEVLRLILPDGTEVESKQQRVGDFWAAGTPLQPRMPMRPYAVTFEVPAAGIGPGQRVRLAVGELGQQKDPLGQDDQWVPSGRRTLVEFGPLRPG